MNLTELSETKRGIPERKINELETRNNNINIRNLYRGINEFRKG
jgi:hypothetical protein